MEYLYVFSKGILADNLVTSHAIGMGMIILFTYSLSEAFWVSLRLNIFLIVQSLFLICLQPIFLQPGKEVFLILLMLGIEVFLSLFVNKLLPKSRIQQGVVGIAKRGDSILPIALATIINQQYQGLDVVLYSAGIGIGFSLILISVTVIAIKLSFHRYPNTKIYAIKFFILGIFAMVLG